MRQILVATDLSPRSEPAARRAAQIASDAHARLTLLHVVDVDLPAELVVSRREQVQAWLARHISPDLNLPPDVQVRSGDPHEEILAVAQELSAELVVLGSHRRRLLLDAFMGTTAERLLSVATRPVLIAHDARTRPYQRILAAIDLSTTSAHALSTAEALGFLTDETYVAYVFHVPAKGKLQQAGLDPIPHIEAERLRAAGALDTFLADCGMHHLRHRVLLREGRRAHEIVSTVSELEPDLLVLGTRGLTGVKKAVLGSVAEAVIRSVSCDVLAVPPPDEG